MKLTLLTICPFLFICFGINAQTFPVTEINVSGSNDKRINFVYLSDGYTAGDLSQFKTDATTVNNALFNTTPFKEYAVFFNTYLISVPSNGSGAQHPGNASDEPTPIGTVPIQAVDNVFGSTFDYFNIHRLLVPTNTSQVYTILGNNFPAYDQPIIIVNSPYYGGSGGREATVSTNEDAAEIAIHELGHSFGKLADEYYAGDFYASEGPNMTQETSPVQVIWKDWMNNNGIGIYQHAGTAIASSWYRPHENCKMRYLGSPFCSVCTEALIDEIYQLVSPIDSHTPTNTALTFTGTPINFSLNLIYPSPNTLEVEWYLNGNMVGSTSDYTLNVGLVVGQNMLEARVIDKTTLSKSYSPSQAGYTFTKNWTINSSSSILENPCPDDLDLTMSIAAVTETHKAANTITASNIIESSANVQYQAGKAITLQPGFHVKNGADFLASIIECTTSVAPSPAPTVLNRSPYATDQETLSVEIMPHPIRQQGVIKYTLPTQQMLSMNLYNLNGQLVKQVLPPQEIPSGIHQLQWESDQLPAGTYFLQIQGEQDIQSKKILLITN